MAKIPLRAYLKEIETLIEKSEIDQAVAHAKHIIHNYPKNINSYRLLGKAYLEGQRFSEASDILQRVLSVIPDDFISQIGMSIIREDEGNLDASIWHMERAYEVQPFNPAVQDELRRLYGRRDGVEPPKIRLTRGALVRMYMRGELYPQAIAEIRAALADDPQRYDLLVLLARLYNLSNQKFEATEVCSTLISKLPYCYEANLILAEILPGTSRAEDAKKFQQRIIALDPYSAYLSPTAPVSEQVADQVVLIEQLTWDPTMQDSQTPEWTRSIGISWEESEEESLPDWINTLTEEPTAQSAQIEEITSEADTEPVLEQPDQDDLVPDWMKESGWTVSERSTDEEQIAESGELEEITPAEIPTWLQSMAPDQSSEVTDEIEKGEWLGDIINNAEDLDAGISNTTDSDEYGLDKTDTLPEPDTMFKQIISEEQKINPDDVTGLVETNEGTSTVEPTPDWLAALEEETLTPVVKLDEDRTEALSDEIAELPLLNAEDLGPDWLRHFGEDTSIEVVPEEFQPESSPEETEANLEITDSPSWLEQLTSSTEADQPVVGSVQEKQMNVPEPVEQLGISSDLVEDIGDDQEVISETIDSQESTEIQTNTVAFYETETPLGLDFKQDVGIENVEEQLLSTTDESATESAVISNELSEEITPDLSDIDSAMAWLEGLAARQGADEATLTTTPEQRSETPPDWVKQQIESEVEEVSTPVDEIETTPEPTDVTDKIDEVGIPDWLQEVESHVDVVPGNVIEDIDEEQGSIEPDLIGSLHPESEQPGISPVGFESIKTSMEFDKEEEPGISEAEGRINEDFDANFAWLESLAARQGAQEGTLISSPDDKIEIPVDFIEGTTEDVETYIEKIEITSSEVEIPKPTSEVPDWLEKVQDEENQDLNADLWNQEIVSQEDEATQILESEINPEWLSEVKIEPIADENMEESLSQWLAEIGEKDLPSTNAEVEPSFIINETTSTWEPEFVEGQSVQDKGSEPTTISASPIYLQETLNRGDIEPAIEGFSQLIQKGEALDETIQILRDALYRYPVDISIWQTLGDAYARNNQLQDAIDAYTRAEELLR